MIETCESCGEFFLTEADPYIVRPTKNGVKLYCYCHINGFDEVKDKTQSIESENAELKKKLEVAAECLEWIAKTDTASIVNGPDVLWLTNWRNTRKQAAINTLKSIESNKGERE